MNADTIIKPRKCKDGLCYCPKPRRSHVGHTYECDILAGRQEAPKVIATGKTRCGDSIRLIVVPTGFRIDRLSDTGWCVEYLTKTLQACRKQFDALTAADFTIQNEGSIFLVRPLNAAAAEHIEERASEEAQWFGGALVVEHRYVAELAERLQEEGFTLS